MVVLDGTLPENLSWRTLVLLSGTQKLGLIWDFAQALAQANNGDVVTAVIVPQGLTESGLSLARNLIEQVKQATRPDTPTHPLLIETDNYQKAVHQLSRTLNIDLVLTEANKEWYNIDGLPCSIGVLRGGTFHPNDQTDQTDFKRILVPTSAGPNTAHALNFLLPLAPQTTITALYVASDYKGPDEIALGQARLSQLCDFIDDDNQIDRKAIRASTITEGIINTAHQGYDMVVIGASRESAFERVLFGDLVGSVIRQSHRPVIVVREPQDRVANIAWRLQNLFPRLTKQERGDVFVRVRESARPTQDYYVLITLAATIAAFGLLLNSPAVVIGAMLVAPLMSPMVGVGMAIVLGDTRFLQLSLQAVLRGMAFAMVVGVIVGFLRPGQPLTAEVLSRTQPTILDLLVALFAGLAGAYALVRSHAAAALPGVAIAAALVPPLAASGIALSHAQWAEAIGAWLLFAANFAAIVSAAVLIFFTFGFRPTYAQKAERTVQQRTTRLALTLLVTMAVVLGVLTYQLATEERLNGRVESVTEMRVSALEAVDFVSVITSDVTDNKSELEIEVVARTTRHNGLSRSEVETLRDEITIDLRDDLAPGREVQFTLVLVPVTELNPSTPPVPTNTPTPTDTPTPGPTPTDTPTPTNTPTRLPTNTPTFLPTNTPTRLPTNTPTPTDTPTNTPIPTATPRLATVAFPFGLNLRTNPSPQAELIRLLPQGTVVTLLDNQQETDGETWQQVEVDGQTGWVLAAFLEAN